MKSYIDNTSTTAVLPEAAQTMTNVMTQDYGNPSSLHDIGFAAEKYIRAALETIAGTLHCAPSNIIFTSGGTESNNHAIIGTALANKRRGRHIITTVVEHPSVTATTAYLEQQGYEVTYLPVDERGRVDANALQSSLRSDTILVSIMLVNNEIGTIQDIAALSKLVKDYDEEIVFHTDAVQAYGKLDINLAKLGADLMSTSAHKLHGPKGVGFLYIADGVKIHPYIHGGGQQKDMRSGTENVPGIAGFSVAAEAAYRELRKSYEKVSELKKSFVDGLLSIEGTHIHGLGGMDDATAEAKSTYERDFTPYIVSCGIKDVRSEVLLHALEEKEIYVSAGSACSANHPGVSPTLKAIGADREFLETTLRFSFSRFTTAEELEYVLEELRELVPRLRKFVRR